MGNSLFHKETPEENKPANPYDLIEKEVEHLKKGTSVRHGGVSKNRNVPWLVIIGFLGLAWLYLMDPFYHAWYKGEAVRAYLYLHQYGGASDLTSLVNSRILSAEEIDVLNHRSGEFRDYYKSADDAQKKVDTIVTYMANVQLLHQDKYQTLDPVGRMRCMIFIRFGIVLPTEWEFLDPAVTN